MFSIQVDKIEPKDQQQSTQQTSKKPIKVEEKAEVLTLEDGDDNVIEFSSGNPKIEVIYGTLRLFRDRNLNLSINELPKKRGTLLCVLAVPAFMSTTDFLKYVECFKSKIQQLRILRDKSPNRYMVLLKFVGQKDADSFYKQYNGKPFNSLDPEDCKIVFVADIIISEKKKKSTISLETDKTKVELPTCPVCLDRLDAETSGVITTMCNHTFHCDCLAKWSDGTCPVCRYSQGQQESVCTTCGSKENLWVCLICGHVGCGRYSGGHANAHYKATNHTYALELESQRVWDYTGDGYVHRLIANKQDGKLIELDKSGLNKDQQEMLEAQYQSKLDYLFKEYNTLLAEQLEKQRVHFETKIMTIEKEKDAQIENLVSELKMYREERQKVAKLSEKYQKKFEKQEEDIKLLRQLNNTLIKNQDDLKKRLQKSKEELQKVRTEKDKEIQELKDQVKDLMFYIETQQKIEKSANKEEIQSGKVLVLNTEPNKKKLRKKHKR